jgi:hypothetical protein
MDLADPSGLIALKGDCDYDWMINDLCEGGGDFTLYVWWGFGGGGGGGGGGSSGGARGHGTLPMRALNLPGCASPGITTPPILPGTYPGYGGCSLGVGPFGRMGPIGGCDFGVCAPVGNGFAIPFPVVGTCLTNPVCTAFAIVATVAVISYYYGPQIIQFAKGGESQNPLPTWVTDRPRLGETADEFAKRVCQARYPPDGAGCGIGAGSEFNKIRKWAQEWINKHK